MWEGDLLFMVNSDFKTCLFYLYTLPISKNNQTPITVRMNQNSKLGITHSIMGVSLGSTILGPQRK